MHGRRAFLGRALAALAAGPGIVRAAPAPSRPAEDFDALWRAVHDGYAYLEPAHDWDSVRARWRPRALAARTREELLAALEGAIAELHDEHVNLADHAPASARAVPEGTDLWARWIGGDAVITAVRAGSVADVAGAVPGLRVTAIRSVPVDRAVRTLLRSGRQADPRARDWALRRLLAGPWSGTLAIDVVADGRPKRLDIAREDLPAAALPPLVARRIGERRDLGYLRIKNNLGAPELVAHFDAALQGLRETRALVLDLRETQADGSPAVARALLGRFVEARANWIIRAPRGSKPAGVPAESVAPRGPFAYRGRVAVLVDSWTAGEAESLACGLEAAARATLVGTTMAGLRGDTTELRLPASGIVLRFPANRVFHVSGKPRELVHPAHPVDIVAPKGGAGDPILYQALKLLESMPALTAAG